ncbi:hypothetical protein Btru_069288 [Bulinus truncatus]|nr:hypothetical protein Btru_069288 [Bulinus truncatus]
MNCCRIFVELIAVCLIVIVPPGLGQGRVGQSATSYTNNLIPSLNRRNGFVGTGTGIGIGIGTGAGAAGIGVGVGVGGVDEFGNPIGLGGAGGFAGGRRLNSCGPLPPSCLPTPVDNLVECKYVYDPTAATCVKIDVIPACATVNSAASNLFNTLVECQQYCL